MEIETTELKDRINKINTVIKSRGMTKSFIARELGYGVTYVIARLNFKYVMRTFKYKGSPMYDKIEEFLEIK